MTCSATDPTDSTHARIARPCTHVWTVERRDFDTCRCVLCVVALECTHEHECTRKGIVTTPLRRQHSTQPVTDK